MSKLLCRFCLSVITNDKYMAFDPGSANSLTVIQKIRCCIPDIDMDLIRNWVMCEMCSNTLNNTFYFIRVCLKSQMLIRDFLKNVSFQGPTKELTSLNRNLIINGVPDQIGNVQHNMSYSTSVILLPEYQTYYNNNSTRNSAVREEANDVIVIDDIDDKLPDTSFGIHRPSREPPALISELQIQSVEGNVIFPGENEAEQPDIVAPEVHLSNIAVHDNKEFDMSSVEQCSILLTRCDDDKSIAEDKTYFVCNICNEIFAENEHLLVHIKSHSSYTELKLVVDPYDVVDAQNHTNSSQLLHRNTFETIDLENYINTYVIEGQFYCKYCNYTTPTKSEYMNHMKRHTSTEPYECQICNHRCTPHSIIRRRLHFNVKTNLYECIICKYRCSVKEILQYLVYTNTRERTLESEIFALQYESEENVTLKYRKQLERSKIRNKIYNIESICVMHEFHKKIEQGTDSICNKKDSKKGKPHVNVSLSASSSTTMNDGSAMTNVNHFICYICNEGFLDKEDLQNHIQTPCSVAEISNSIPNRDRVTSIQLSDQETNNDLSLQNNVGTHATQERPFQCKFCGFAFAQQYILMDHMRAHAIVKAYKCNFCVYQCVHLYDFVEHMRIHGGIKRFECGTCRRKFSDENALKDHSNIHTGKKPYQCSFCDSKFAFKPSLRNHVKTHNKKMALKPHVNNLNQDASVKAEKCPQYRNEEQKTDISLLSLLLSSSPSVPLQCNTNNINKSTPNKNHFICYTCNEGFSDKEDLRNHVQEQCSGVVEISNLDSNKKTADSVCGYKTNDESSLENHLKIYTKTKHFRCKYCNYVSLLESNLANHMMIHIKERPHECDVCNYRFRQLSHLRLHLRSHSNLKPVHVQVGKKQYQCKLSAFKPSILRSRLKKVQDNKVPVETKLENILYQDVIVENSGSKFEDAQKEFGNTSYLVINSVIREDETFQEEDLTKGAMLITEESNNEIK